MFGRWLVVVFALLSLGVFVASELSRRFASYSSDAYVATDVILIAPVVSGRLVDVAVRDNETVSAGDLLAQVDPEPYRLARDAAEAALDLARQQEQAAKDAVNSAQAAVDSAEAALKDTQDTYDRIKALTERGVTTQQRLDNEAASLTSARDDVTEAQTSLTEANDTVKTRITATKQADVALQQAAYDLRMTSILAPTDGRIAPFDPRTGAYATAGDALFALVSSDNWRIIVNLPEQNLAHLAVGQPAWVMVASSPWRLVPGHVKSIAPGVSRSIDAADPLPYVAIDTDWVRLSQRFPVEIVLNDPVPIPLYRGADARVFIRHEPGAQDPSAGAAATTQ